MKYIVLLIGIVFLLSCERAEKTCLSTLKVEGNTKLFRTSFMPNKYFYLASNTLLKIRTDSLCALDIDKSELQVGKLYLATDKWSVYELKKDTDFTMSGLVIFDESSIIGLAFLKNSVMMPFVTTKSLKADLLAYNGSISWKYFKGNRIEIDENTWPRNTYDRLDSWIE
jgi:hypothetical protein